MIFCLLFPPPPPLIKVASNTRLCSKLGGTTLKGREEGGRYYISQTCDQQGFEARKVIFSLECLNIFASGYRKFFWCYSLLFYCKRWPWVMVVVALRSPLMGWKAVVVYIQDRGFNSLTNNVIKLSVKYLKTL